MQFVYDQKIEDDAIQQPSLVLMTFREFKRLIPLEKPPKIRGWSIHLSRSDRCYRAYKKGFPMAYLGKNLIDAESKLFAFEEKHMPNHKDES